MNRQNKPEELNTKNKELFDEIKFYLLTGPTSESKARKVLEELEDHMLLAQQDGKSFEDVFGKDPKAFCDEMMKEIPKPSLLERSKLLILTPVLLVQWKLAEGIDGRLRLSLFDTGGFIIVSLIIIFLFLLMLRKASFKPYKGAYWMIFSLSFFTFMIFIGLAFAEKRFWPEGPSLELHGFPAYSLGTIGVLLIPKVSVAIIST